MCKWLVRVDCGYGKDNGMKLSIRNFAKIEHTDIIVDGITVIAGENNTGKSTVGKIMFAIFNALSGIEEKIIEERFKEIENTIRFVVRNYTADTNRSTAMRYSASIAGKISHSLSELLYDQGSIGQIEIRDIIEKAVRNSGYLAPSKDQNDWYLMIDEMIQNTNEVLSLPENAIILEVITRYFKNVFHDQINSISAGQEEEAAVSVEIKGKTDNLVFYNNECRNFTEDISIVHNAIYIDNPFILDELSSYNELNPMNEYLKQLLAGESKEGIMNGIIESMLTREKLSEIYRVLQNVVDGQIILNQDEEFYLKHDSFREPISIHNLSTGLKSFVILKILLEKGCLKEKDVLVLDEPEIHLHPQWQVIYAEMIVLLQKQFELSIIVTTHSPYFLDAINLFSCKYGIENKTNYYLSSLDQDRVKMQLVTGNVDMIYKKMASPIQMLDSLRYELNNK